MGAKPSLPKLPARGYYKNGDGYKTLDTDKARAEIRKTQKLLNWYAQKHIEAGKIEKIEPDGKYGDKSTKMTKYVQGLLKLDKNGCFGNSCLSKLKAISSPAPAPKVAKKTVAVQDKNPEINTDPKVVFETVVAVQAKHKGGANTIEAIKKKKVATCSGTASAYLNMIGCLSGGGIGHTKAVKNGNSKNTISKAMSGNVKGLKNCKIVKVMKPWKEVPSWLKRKGNVGIQNSNAFVVKSDSSFYNCNLTGCKYVKMSQIIKGINSYCGKNAVLYMVVPWFNYK